MATGYLTCPEPCPNMGGMAGRPYAYEWANERLDGSLEERLRSWRDGDLSNLAIRDELKTLGVEVAVETVRRWLNALPEPERAA